MYTLLFALVLLCVLAVVRDRPRRYAMSLCSATLALSVLAFLPHVIDHRFSLGL
ncbi:hypothetical protein [Nocardia sp. IFM 10818]